MSIVSANGGRRRADRAPCGHFVELCEIRSGREERQMRFGTILTRASAEAPGLIREAERAGISSAYVADHPSYGLGDPWTVLAAAAVLTETIRLGTHVVAAPLHHPTQLANQVAVVDSQNKVAIHNVTPGERVGKMWIITDGLKPGERVVAEGVQKVGPGVQVNPKPFTPNKGS